MARKFIPYQTSWGEVIPGLYRGNDQRWRIVATGERFREPDERRAVQRFREWEQSTQTTIPIPAEVGEVAPIQPTAVIDGQQVSVAFAKWLHEATNAMQAVGEVEGSKLKFTYPTIDTKLPIPEKWLWSWLRNELIERPEYIAKMTGIPEVAALRRLPLPKPSLKIQDLLTLYRKHNPATEKSKNEAISAFDMLLKFAPVKTLDDLTQETMLAFRQYVEAKQLGPATKSAYYARIKSILAFGLKCGQDAQQIRSALDRCKVLWTPDPKPPANPTPISRENWIKLLTHAEQTPWRAWMLVGLNLCMHMEECCGLRWADLDVDNGTYASIRHKTRRHNIPRAAVLWNETIAELRKLPRRGEYVFISSHGTRYNKNSRINDFKSFRKAAGVPDEVTWDSLRDGAYTIACQAVTDERWARVLAGHSAAGLQDRYVLRNPAITRPACEAVHKAYME